jgi:indolepyruvate ferredoxin oxidoreductase beta subunit
MVPAGRAHFLLALEDSQVEVNREVLGEDAAVLRPGQIDISKLNSPRSLNIAMLGLLSAHLDLPVEHFVAAVRANLPPAAHGANLAAFEYGRSLK